MEWNRSEYLKGIDYGLSSWWLETHDAQWSHDISAVMFETAEFREGYRDALDDSDDMPEPFDPEETFVP